MNKGGDPLRSQRWFGGEDVGGVLHRASVKADGFSRAALDGRPVIGICSAWSELVHCNVHFRGLTSAVKRGVLQAGGLPLEFPTISLSENLMKPTTMLYRNLMAMDVEESIHAHPLDAVVLIGGCDKTQPAQLMGAASADVPAIVVTGGPGEPAHFRGRELGVGTDLWRYTNELRAGKMTIEEYGELEAALIPSPGHCNELGSASTFAIVTEALGMSLPGCAAIPAMDSRRAAMAERTGGRAVELALEGLRPSSILTSAAFDNAITALLASAGSTNAVIHLVALARRVGIDLRLNRFRELSARTPVLLNLRPSGEHLMEQLFLAGGVPAFLRELAPLLDLETITVSGLPLGECLAQHEAYDRGVIAPLDAPLYPHGAIDVLYGNLAPDGAVIKRSAATPELLRHRGPALVFEDIHEVAARIDDPDLPATADTVFVLRGAGPVGAPGMPEWGMLPIPTRLLRAGVRDVVRISDARMSGTAFGTVVLHVAPEAAVGGPLALVENGDPIALDAEAGELTLDVDEAELARRRSRWIPPAPRYRRGYGAIFLEHVMQADRGCDFDLLPAIEDDPSEREPYGLLRGWVCGW